MIVNSSVNKPTSELTDGIDSLVNESDTFLVREDQTSINLSRNSCRSRVSGLGSRVSGLSAERHYKSFPQEIHTQTKMIRTKFLNGHCVMNISTTPQKYVACAMENQCCFLVVVVC